MRKLALFAMLSATAALSLAGPRPPKTLLFSLKDHSTHDIAITPNGRRIYYSQDTIQLYMYDRETRRTSPILGPMAGVGANPGLALSPAGDRLAFARSAEGSGEKQLWTVSLDPATGLPNGPARRVSILVAHSPAFSPDGKSIAFATPVSRTAKKLVVIPVNGGPERVVAETEGDVWPITWQKPDSIYFSLGFGEKENMSKNGVYRVGVSGGKPQMVLRTADWGGYPGLSPDGRFLLAYDSTWDSVMVTTSSGRHVFSYEPDLGEVTADVWFNGGRTVGWKGWSVRTVVALDLTGEQQRVVADSSELRTSSWSPDGRRVASVGLNPSRFIISDVAAGTKRSIRVDLAPGPTAAVYWSPDGRSIAYRDPRGPLLLLDVETSKVRRLAATSCLSPIARWRSDGRAIIYAAENTPNQTRDIRKLDIHEVTLDGRDRVLSSIESRCYGNMYWGKIIDDSLLATWENAEYRVTNVRTSGARAVYKRDGTPQQPVPTFSSNGKWMAVRKQSSSDQRWSIEVMRPDGSAHRSVPLSFATLPGGRNPWISDDGTQLIVASPECGENDSRPCANGNAKLYRVDVATGKATSIASVPSGAINGENGMISNDGRSVVFLREIEKRVDFYEIDFSSLLRR